MNSIVSRPTLPIGTKVTVVSLKWGEADKPLYNDDLVGLTGEVIDHDNDHYTPPNVVHLENGTSYFLPNECLQVIGSIL